MNEAARAGPQDGADRFEIIELLGKMIYVHSCQQAAATGRLQIQGMLLLHASVVGCRKQLSNLSQGCILEA